MPPTLGLMAVLTKRELAEIREELGHLPTIRNLLDTLEATEELVENVLPHAEQERDEAQKQVRILTAEIDRLTGHGRLPRLPAPDK